MWNHFLVTTILIVSTGNVSGLPIQKYDYPGNRNLPKSKVYPALGITTAHSTIYRVQSIRLIPWSEYTGSKDTEKTISPDRMVWEVLRADCRVRKVPDYIYFFMANDAQTGKPLTKRHFQYTTDLKTLPQIQARGPDWKLNKCPGTSLNWPSPP
jgi:hypothetical protein